MKLEWTSSKKQREAREEYRKKRREAKRELVGDEREIFVDGVFLGLMIGMIIGVILHIILINLHISWGYEFSQLLAIIGVELR